MRKTPYPAWPFHTAEEVDAATSVLESGKTNYWTGEQGRAFEREFAAASGCRYGVAVANGTVALELALWACEIGAGDEVVVPCRSFVASASSICRLGAAPVFADVDQDSQNITAQTIEKALSPRARAIVAVHLAGWPCEMGPIMELAEKHGLMVIEDCAQAHGARLSGRSVGQFGHCAAFSFCQDKILSTGGEGGMLTTNDERIWKRAWSLKDHGKSYDLCGVRPGQTGFRWLHTEIGTNWRLTEVQSAIGRAALPRLELDVAARRRNAAQLAERIGAIRGLRAVQPPPHVFHSYYRFYAFVEKQRLLPGWTRDRLIEAIAAEGVPCSAGSCGEIYREKAFEALVSVTRRLPVAAELFDTSLAFLVHPTAAERDMDDVCLAVEKVSARALRP